MYELQWDSSFIKAFTRKTKSNVVIKSKIIDSLQLLEENPFNPKLRTHKLQGILKGLYACTVDYDLRIVFSITDESPSSIVLIDIGTHDEVY